MKKFAWRIAGGDVIYVAESYPSRLVGVGRVRGSEQKSAYQYQEDTPIVDDDHHPWCHLLDVEWEQDFKAVRYPDPWAAQTTVLDLEPLEVKKIQTLLDGKRTLNQRAISSFSDKSAPDVSDDPIQQRQLEDWAYTRYTAAAIKIIHRRHVGLCNQFTSWLTHTFKVAYEVERQNIDLTFRLRGKSYLVEFKIAYTGDAKPAIREALGQILEYNLYPRQRCHDHWVLVLDCRPNAEDFTFLAQLRQLKLPLSFGWPSGEGFEFSNTCELHI